MRVSLVVAAGLLVGLPIGPHAAPPAPQASITVLTPNGGEVWPLGSRQTIRWTSTDITGPVRIRLKRGLLW
ncbi:MAG: hypothetical protein D6723_03280 [Acidobacteria bacterium]|nr:MAG: hypothetical protein D6723_03280 [Acidobacteriota bacterium]